MKSLLRFFIPVIFFSTSAFAQDVVRGVIKNGDGTPLPGATVSIKNTTASALADTNGEFSITAPKAKWLQKITITISFFFVVGPNVLDSGLLQHR